MSHGRARENAEEGLGKDRADRHQKKGDDKFYPARRDHPGVGLRVVARDRRGDFHATSAATRPVMKRCLTFLLRRHVNRRLRRLTAKKEANRNRAPARARKRIDRARARARARLRKSYARPM